MHFSNAHLAQEVEDVVFWSKIVLAVATGVFLGFAGIEGWYVFTE
jgi:hypothetical protein